MKVEELSLSGAYTIQPNFFKDERGYFFEWFNLKNFKEASGVDFVPVQFNCSKSSIGVLRGMHFQLDPHAQAKVVSLHSGVVQDVIIDVRPASPTFGKYESVILDADKKNQLYIPRGFAHGFLVLSETAEIFYAADNYYAPASEGGVMYNDPGVAIEWELKLEKLILSEKDQKYDLLSQQELNFEYNG